MRVAREMSAIEVRKLTDPGMHFVGGVPGLALLVQPTGARTWVLRMVVGARRREMGLGGFPGVTLAGARDAARAARAKVRDGIDPIEEARAARSALRASQAAALTFAECATRYIEANRAGWKSAKHAQQWANTLEQHAYPVIGHLLVRDVSLTHVMAVLEPIWTTRTETASRLRGRIETVLDWAAVRGMRDKDNPARWRGHLDKLLPAPSKVAKVEHHAAVPVAQVGEFMARLREQVGTGARALEFAILTAARSGEVRGATWGEVDLDAGVWVVPASRMKSKREHRVPLSQASVDILRAMGPSASDAVVFPAPRGGTLSDMTLTAVLRRMNVPATVHGFRSTFRDWVGERTSFPRDIAEMALAHAIENKAEAAYRRGDMFDRRRRMMDEWATFVAQPGSAVVVVPIMSRRA